MARKAQDTTKIESLIAEGNEFVEQHVTDTVYKRVVGELSARKKGTKGSRKIKLTSEMLRNFVFYVSMGLSLRSAANKSGIGENTRKDYALKSTTFSELSSQAETDPEDAAIMAVVKAIKGTKPGYVKITHPVTGQPDYIQIKGAEPNVTVAQWYLEKIKFFGSEDGESEAPALGAPQNEKEAELLERLLNKHHDYVQAKKANKK